MLILHLILLFYFPRTFGSVQSNGELHWYKLCQKYIINGSYPANCSLRLL